MTSTSIVGTRDGELAISSEIIAERAEVEHRAILQLISGRNAEIEELEGVAFEMQPFEAAGGIQRRSVADRLLLGFEIAPRSAFQHGDRYTHPCFEREGANK